MRYSRQEKILELIQHHEINTQEKLVELLNEAGYKVTQATISRDIKNLQLIKTMTVNGRYKYAVRTGMEQPVNDLNIKLLRNTIQSVSSSGNIIVVKTLPGCAFAAAEAIDNSSFTHVIGCVTGNNTIFVLIDDEANVESLITRLNQIIN